MVLTETFTFSVYGSFKKTVFVRILNILNKAVFLIELNSFISNYLCNYAIETLEITIQCLMSTVTLKHVISLRLLYKRTTPSSNNKKQKNK